MFFFTALTFLSKSESITYDDDNIVYVTESNFTNVMKTKPAAILFIQQGDFQRYRYLSDFISASSYIGTRCYFAIMDGDRNKYFVQQLHLKHTKGYYFYRYGEFVEEYKGDPSPDSIYKYAMEKTGLPFTTFDDYPTAQEFIESHPISVVLFEKKAGGPLFEKFNEIAERNRDNYAFGCSPDPDVTYELRIRYVPSIVLYRNTDKSKIFYPYNLTEGTVENITEWIEQNKNPNYEIFNINNQQIYEQTKELGLFFTPVEQEDLDKALRTISMVTTQYKNKLRFAVIDAVNGNRFMQSIGFSRYADPAFCVLNYTGKRVIKYLYTEGSEFRPKQILHFIDEVFAGNINQTIRCSELPQNNTDIVSEINSKTMKSKIQDYNCQTVILFYEEWDRLYSDFLPIFREIAAEFPNLQFAKMDASKNDILYGHMLPSTPCIKIFGSDPKSKTFTYTKKLLKEPVTKWIKRKLQKKDEL